MRGLMTRQSSIQLLEISSYDCNVTVADLINSSGDLSLDFVYTSGCCGSDS